MKRIPLLVVAAMLAGLVGRPVFADQEWEPAVRRGVEFLRSQVSRMNSGEAALAALAMNKARIPVNDPGLVACIAKFGANFNGTSYLPETKGGSEIYEASVAIMAMTNIDRIGYKPYIEAACEYIRSKQMPNGAWDDSSRTGGDVSMTQSALLGLWEGENIGVKVPAKVWENAARWCLSVQSSQGSWNDRRDEPSSPETVTTTGAGVCSLMICQSQLARHRRGQEPFNPLMTPIIIDGVAFELRNKDKVEPSSESINNGIRAGIKWMGDHFQTSNAKIVGPSVIDCLYGIERVTALAEKLKMPVPTEWSKRGLAYVLANQKPSGAWDVGQQKEVLTTCWAILFSTRATEQTVKRVEILLLPHGDRGSLPRWTKLEDVEVVRGELVAKPMGGAIDDMLAAIEDPKGEHAEAAFAGLVTKYQAEGPKVLRPHKERFRRLLHNRDEGLRKVAIWALGRTGDLDVAPLLIKALLDPDEDVMNEARVSLQVLSRKLDGFGPEPKSSNEERQAAALQWQQWFESVKPPDLDSPDALPINTAK